MWQEDSESARRFGIASTPAVFVNGRLFAGARSFEELSAAIDEELSASKR